MQRHAQSPQPCRFIEVASRFDEVRVLVPRQAHDAPPTAPANWQAAPARDVAAGDSRSRWAPPSQQDYAPAPQSRPADSRYYDEPQVNAEPYGAYADEGGQEHQQDQHEGEYYDQDDGALEPEADSSALRQLTITDDDGNCIKFFADPAQPTA